MFEMPELSRMASLQLDNDPAQYLVTVYRAGGDGLLTGAETTPCPGQSFALAAGEAAAKRHAMVIVFRETEDDMGVRRASVLKVFGDLPNLGELEGRSLRGGRRNG